MKFFFHRPWQVGDIVRYTGPLSDIADGKGGRGVILKENERPWYTSYIVDFDLPTKILYEIPRSSLYNISLDQDGKDVKKT